MIKVDGNFEYLISFNLSLFAQTTSKGSSTDGYKEAVSSILAQIKLWAAPLSTKQIVSQPLTVTIKSINLCNSEPIVS